MIRLMKNPNGARVSLIFEESAVGTRGYSVRNRRALRVPLTTQIVLLRKITSLTRSIKVDPYELSLAFSLRWRGSTVLNC